MCIWGPKEATLSRRDSLGGLRLTLSYQALMNSGLAESALSAVPWSDRSCIACYNTLNEPIFPRLSLDEKKACS